MNEIVESIEKRQSAKAASIIEKTLRKKLFNAISEKTNFVARDTYGYFVEDYGGADEQPQFMNPNDNSYAAFFKSALQKFGVTGPQDFTDPATKQQFFDYIDHNWRAQDSVQQPLQANGGGGVDSGTGTTLPAPATQPMVAVQANTPGQGQDPSVAAMAGTAGPTVDQTPAIGQQPLGSSGQDPQLNNLQNLAAKGQNPGCSWCGSVDGQDPDLNTSLNDACPTCGNSMNQNDSDTTDDDEDMDQFGNDDDDQQQDLGQPESDLDDPFDDEDAFTVDHSDFLPFDGDDSSDEFDTDDQDGFGNDAGSDDDNQSFGNNNDSDDDQDPDFDVSDEDDDSDDEDDDQPATKSKKKNPFVSEALKSTSYSRKDRKPASKKVSRVEGKKVIKITEDFGFGDDNADDEFFILEKFDLFQQAKDNVKTQGLHPDVQKSKMQEINGGMKQVMYVQKQLDQIKSYRDAMLSQLRKERQAIKVDRTKDPAQVQQSLKALAQMAIQNRKYFKDQAKQIKAIFTGKFDDSAPITNNTNDDDDNSNQKPSFGNNSKKKNPFPVSNNKKSSNNNDDDDDTTSDSNDVDSTKDNFSSKKKKNPFDKNNKNSVAESTSFGKLLSLLKE